jgi:hypothetical protein
MSALLALMCSIYMLQGSSKIYSYVMSVATPSVIAVVELSSRYTLCRSTSRDLGNWLVSRNVIRRMTVIVIPKEHSLVGFVCLFAIAARDDRGCQIQQVMSEFHVRDLFAGGHPRELLRHTITTLISTPLTGLTPRILEAEDYCIVQVSWVVAACAMSGPLHLRSLSHAR